MPTVSPLSLTAVDGYPLAARHFSTESPKATLVIGAATGVPQGFYKRFADYAALHGYDVITTDYRGIGLSAPKSLRGFRMDYLDWSRYDLAAAVDHAAALGRACGSGRSFPRRPCHWPLAEPSQAPCGLYLRCGCWLAWLDATLRADQGAPDVVGDRPGAYRHPWLSGLEQAWHGRGSASGCLSPVAALVPLSTYFFEDPAMAETLKPFAEVHIPIKAVNALDDLWAPPASRDAFMAGYRNAPLERQDIDPAIAGMGPIGHMGYFRPAAQALWDEMLRWLDSKLV